MIFSEDASNLPTDLLPQPTDRQMDSYKVDVVPESNPVPPVFTCANFKYFYSEPEDPAKWRGRWRRELVEYLPRIYCSRAHSFPWDTKSIWMLPYPRRSCKIWFRSHGHTFHDWHLILQQSSLIVSLWGGGGQNVTKNLTKVHCPDRRFQSFKSTRPDNSRDNIKNISATDHRQAAAHKIVGYFLVQVEVYFRGCKEVKKTARNSYPFGYIQDIFRKFVLCGKLRKCCKVCEDLKSIILFHFLKTLVFDVWVYLLPPTFNLWWRTPPLVTIQGI